MRGAVCVLAFRLPDVAAGPPICDCSDLSPRRQRSVPRMLAQMRAPARRTRSRCVSDARPGKAGGMMKCARPGGTMSMPIIDLRQMSAWQLEPLLEEEAGYWRQELYWDYRPSLELIKKFVDARSLGGFSAMENSKPAGYGFYVLEEHKGLLGGLFVSPRFPQLAISQELLAEMLSVLRNVPGIERVEAQLIPFGYSLDATLIEHGFQLYDRQFMLLPLDGARAAGGEQVSGLRLERWEIGR